MQLVSLSAYRNQKVVEVLRELLDLAENGEVRGLTFVVKFGPGDHRVGTVGDYRRCPEEALSATLLLKRTLLEGQAHEERLS